MSRERASEHAAPRKPESGPTGIARVLPPVAGWLAPGPSCSRRLAGVRQWFPGYPSWWRILPGLRAVTEQFDRARLSRTRSGRQRLQREDSRPGAKPEPACLLAVTVS